jgi:hypothetical protein
MFDCGGTQRLMTHTLTHLYIYHLSLAARPADGDSMCQDYAEYQRDFFQHFLYKVRSVRLRRLRRSRNERVHSV